MRKIVIMFVSLCLVACAMTGCSKEKELSVNIVKLEKMVSELEDDVHNLEAQKRMFENEIRDIKIQSNTAKYIVTLNIKQSHFTLDLGQHMKDEMNDISIQIPVDKEYFDSINVGDTIADDFRMGSLIFKGSFGNWKVTVQAKEIL